MKIWIKNLFNALWWLAIFYMVLGSPRIGWLQKNFDYTDNGTSITITHSTWGAVGDVEIPATIRKKPVTSIGDSAFFRDCNRMTSITIPNSLTSIGDSAFAGTFMTSITIPAGVTRIGRGAFQRCYRLTGITIPTCVTSIGDSAFEDCWSLTSISIPASVTSIGDGAFDSCNNLTAINVDANNPNYSSVNGVLYDKNQTTLILCPQKKSGTVTIPSSFTSIRDHAFRNCKALNSVIIPTSVTSIGEYAFADCSSLTSVTIPTSVTSIDGFAFFECSSLAHVTIPASVTKIGNKAFAYSGLRSAHFSGNAPEMGVGVFEVTGWDFTVSYISGNTGFTSLIWNSYKVVCKDESK